MNHLKKISFVILVGMATMFETGCIKKGPDDPLISLETRMTRMSQDWVLVQYEKNDGVIDLTGTYSEWDIHKNSTLTQTEEGTMFGFAVRTSSDGNWSFIDSKKSISININNEVKNYLIDRLSSTELWLTYYQGSDTYFLHFQVR